MWGSSVSYNMGAGQEIISDATPCDQLLDNLSLAVWRLVYEIDGAMYRMITEVVAGLNPTRLASDGPRSPECAQRP